MRAAFAIACLTFGLSVFPVRATIYTDGLLVEPEHQTIQEVRETRRQLERPIGQRQLSVSLAAVIGLGVIAAGFTFHHFRRRA